MLELDFDDVIEAPVPVVVEPPKRYLGVYPNLPEKEYRRAPGMNKSGMDNFMRSPAHYITMKKNQPPPTPQMFIGTALHTLILEPERFELEFIPDEYRGSASKEAKLWRMEMQALGKTVINTAGSPTDIWNVSDWDMIHHMRDAVRAHPVANILLQGKTEQSLFWVDKKHGDHEGTGKLCKARIDVHNEDHNVNCDLKSAADASYSGFQKAVHRYHYYIQDAFYSDGWKYANGLDKLIPFIFVVVEKEPPYGVGCYTIEKEWQRVGREIYQRTLVRFDNCKEADEWPCYPIEVRDLVMPGYGKYHDIS